MASWLLDTNVLTEPMRPQPDPGILRGLREHAGDLAIAAPTWHEAVYGMSRMPAGKRRDAIHWYLYEVVAPGVEVLPYDARAATWHARERARLVARGLTPPFVDGQIAAIAACQGLTLVTRNRRDFEGFEGLALVDWAGEETD